MHQLWCEAIPHTIMDNMDRATHIQKTVIKVSIRQQPSDFAYWQSQPYRVRLAALEEIRQGYHRWRHDAESRLQRVYRIVKR